MYFLHTVTLWFVNASEVSSMSVSSDIVWEAEGPERERRRRRTRKLGLVEILRCARECRMIVHRGRGVEAGRP